MKYKKIGIISSIKPGAFERKKELIKRFSFIDYESDKNQEIDLLVTLGGDGFFAALPSCLSVFKNTNIWN